MEAAAMFAGCGERNAHTAILTGHSGSRKPNSKDLNCPSEWSCGQFAFLSGRRDTQLEEDLVNGARIAILLAGCVLVQGPDDITAIRCSARLRGSRTSRIGLLNNSGCIGRTGYLLGPCERELLVCEDERSRPPRAAIAMKPWRIFRIGVPRTFMVKAKFTDASQGHATLYITDAGIID